MKNFLKYTLATITGIIISGILFTVIMLFGLGAMVASSTKQVAIDKNSVLVLNTGAMIPERGSEDPFSSFDPVDFTFKPSAGLNDIIKNLDKAASDDRIKGVLIENGPMANGLAKAEEIREALLKFKESGKFVISYTEYYMTQESYYISTVADKIYLSPVAILEFKGLSSDIMFYTRALEKLGIEVQVIRHGRFKGAVEPFTSTTLSPENRSQIERFTSGIWNNILSGISVMRGIPVDELNRVADGLLTTSIEKALELKMVDGLMYRDQIKQEIDTITGSKSSYVSMTKYKNVHVARETTPGDGKIALLFAEGTIVMGKGNISNIGGTYYASVIREIRESDKYDALVIRINSPGGNAMASDLIWREVELAAKKMPVVVSMSNYAASGGYYFAAPATSIFAHTSTLTGSIGVFGLFPQGKGLLENKLGVTTESVKTNRYSDSPSVFRPMDPGEDLVFQQNVDHTYNEFVSRVSEGRGISEAEVDLMGEGHVFFGTDALDNGLIDRIGGLADALDEAASLAEISGYTISEYPVVEDAYTRILKSLGGEIRSSFIEKELGSDAMIYSDLKEIRSLSGIQARLPFFISIR
ncbi:MAG: signal peptide peptidase SppA [Bacteroidia bacterium]|nr:MAG: signal peptide peptidase SppA [Bacteroidia bacterium]